MGFWTPSPKPLDLSVHERGHGGPPLVLVHGWGLGSHIWHPAFHQLDTRFRIFAVDLPGHGDSPPWPPAADVATVAAAVADRVPAGAIWAGWSLGGLVALAAAAAGMGGIGGLCLVATNPRFVAGPGWPDGVSPAVLRSFKDLLRSDPDGVRRRFAALLMTTAAERRLIRDALAREPAWGDARHRLLKPLDLLASSDLCGSLAHIHCPVEWILGVEDRLVPHGLAAALDRLRPDWGVRTVPGGHAFFLSRPGDLCDAVERLRGIHEH